MLNEKKISVRTLTTVFLLALALIFCLGAAASSPTVSPTVAPTATVSPTAAPEAPVVKGYGWALDLLVLATLVLFVLYGVYKGFLCTVLHLAGAILSWVLAFAFYPTVASWLAGNTDINNLILNFTQGSSNIHDVELLNQSVSSLDVSSIRDVIAGANLPDPIGSILESNILQQVFSGTGLTSLSQYFDQTFTNFVLNILSFLLIFLAVKLVVAILIKLTDLLARLPVLKQFNRFFGGVAGLVRGAFVCYLVFSLVPLLLTVVPNEMLVATVENSFFAGIFYKGNIISHVVSGIVS